MSVQYLTQKDKTEIAYIHTPPSDEGKALAPVIFFGGYMSNMDGTKATYFETQCKMRGQEYIRFDYGGHGCSGGKFEEGTLTKWTNDALLVFDHLIKKPAVLVGSSMGGAISLHTALKRPEYTKAWIGLAAAPDFTESMYAELTDDQQKTLQTEGRVIIPSEYEHPYIYTKDLYEDGQNNLLLNKKQIVSFPMHIIHGKEDTVVPWSITDRIQKAFQSPNIQTHLIEQAAHGLSRPEDLMLINKIIMASS